MVGGSPCRQLDSRDPETPNIGLEVITTNLQGQRGSVRRPLALFPDGGGPLFLSNYHERS